KTPEEDKVRELYAWAFSRAPDSEELKLAREYFTKKTANLEKDKLTAAKRQAYEDIIWALISTKEFLFNH
ncbi:MAG: hypothetical protein AB1813_25715, partial [Verrucomicrobiota bacterium]